MVHEEVLDDVESAGWMGMDPETVASQVRVALPPALQDLEFQVDLAFQDPRPLNPLAMGDRQIYIYDGVTGRVSTEALAALFKHLPGKVAQCRIFARDRRHTGELTEAFRQVLFPAGPPRPSS
jgi:hypothetical protein